MSAPLSIHHLFRGILWSFRRLLAFLGQPAHHAAQLRAHNLDGMLLLFFAQGVELVPPALVLRNPLPRELATLNVGERLLHGGGRRLAPHLLAARPVAIFPRF